MDDATLMGWITLWARENDGASDDGVIQVMKLYDFRDMADTEHSMWDLFHVYFAMWYLPFLGGWVYWNYKFEAWRQLCSDLGIAAHIRRNDERRCSTGALLVHIMSVISGRSADEARRTATMKLLLAIWHKCFLTGMTYQRPLLVQGTEFIATNGALREHDTLQIMHAITDKLWSKN